MNCNTNGFIGVVKQKMIPTTKAKRKETLMLYILTKEGLYFFDYGKHICGQFKGYNERYSELAKLDYEELSIISHKYLERDLLREDLKK